MESSRPPPCSLPLVYAPSSFLIRWASLQSPLCLPSCPQILPSRSSSSPEHQVPSYLQMDDAGQYQCLAENEMGAVEKVVVLVLQSESRPRPGAWGDQLKQVLSGCGEAVAAATQAVS